jgi:hypothetical protein
MRKKEKNYKRIEGLTGFAKVQTPRVAKWTLSSYSSERAPLLLVYLKERKGKVSFLIYIKQEKQADASPATAPKFDR